VPIRIPAPGRRFKSTVTSELLGALASRNAAAICVISAAFGLVYIHFESTLPLYLGEKGRTGFLPVMFVINAVVVVASQFLATGLVRRFSTAVVCVTGFAFYAVGYACFISGAFWMWAVGVVVFSFGEVVVTLMLDNQIAIVSGGRPAQLFGLSSLANAFGGVGGGWAGSALLGVRVGSSAWFSWVVVAPTTLMLGMAAAIVSRWLQPETAATAPEVIVDHG
jgi:hypothetical protein